MAVQKFNGFDAPYRSQTFQAQAGSITGMSGLLMVSGPVTMTGGVITVPPFMFIQKGLITNKDDSYQLLQPTIPAPYHLVVTAATTADTDDLLWSFAHAPSDLVDSDVIVASFDGVEWHQPPLLSTAGLLRDEERLRLASGQIGPTIGLQTTLSGGVYTNSPGALIDRNGDRQVFRQSQAFAQIGADPDFSRVDKIVYRRPMDSLSRIGQRQFLLGGTYASTPTAVYQRTGYLDTSSVRQGARMVIAPDNSAHIFTASGYGTSYQLTYTKMAGDRQTTLVQTTTITTVTDPGFSVAVDLSGNLHLVYSVSGQIFYRKLSSTGTTLVAAVRIDQQIVACTRPYVALDPQNLKVFVVFQALLGAANNQPFLTTLTINGAVITAPVRLVSNNTNLQNFNVSVTGDLAVYVAWEDTTAAQVSFQPFDDVGNPLQAAQVVSSQTTRLGYGTLMDQATAPRVRVADNKSVFVSFLQNKGGAVYGLSIWNDGQAFMQALTSPTENIASYSFELDETTNGCHFGLCRTASVDYVKLEGQTVIFALNLSSSGASGMVTRRDALGSMFHVWTEPKTGTFATYKSSAHLIAIGPSTLAGSVSPVTLAANQFLVRQSEFSGQTPKAGDNVTISGSAVSGNNATRSITAVTAASQNASQDSFIVTTATNFIAAESPSPNGLGAFASPTGNGLDCAKTTSEVAALAYRLDPLATDVLLTRLGMPGNYILNFLRGDKPALDSDSFLVHGGSVVIDYGKTAANTVTIAGNLKILDMVHNVDFTLAPGGYPVVDGQAIYVVLDPANQAPVPQVVAVNYLPWSSPIQVLGIVKDSAFNPSIILSSAGLGQIMLGEQDQIGEDLPLGIRARVGILDDTTYVAYPSTLVIGTNDSYPVALGKLDAQVGALENNHPLEDHFSGDGTTALPVFTTTVTGLSWSTDNTVMDLQVWVDGRRQPPFRGTGAFTYGFRKTSTTSFQLAGVVHVGSFVDIRKEGTSYGGPTPPTAGKLWSDQVDHDIIGLDSAYNLGSVSQRFKTAYLAEAQVGQLTLSTPLGLLSIIKSKTNGSNVAMVAGQPGSLFSDGKIYPSMVASGSGQKVVCILIEPIAAGASGRVLLVGYNIPGVLTGLGFSPGDEVYVDETGNYSSGAVGLNGAADTLQRVGYADCATATAATVATDLIMGFQTISEAP